MAQMDEPQITQMAQMKGKFRLSSHLRHLCHLRFYPSA
jgi:hypothetical protein